MRLRNTLRLLPALALALVLSVPALAVDPSFSAPGVTPEELAKTLKAEKADKPAMFQVGFRVLFVQAHIPGSVYAGPGREEQGIEALKKAVAKLPKGKAIVLYCGCCPWERCPNLEPAYAALKAAGFTNVKVLKIPQNFGADWVQKGYPTAKGDA